MDLPIGLIAEIMLAIGILVLLAFFFIDKAYANLNPILPWLGLGQTQSQSQSAVETVFYDAVRCSYYRCTEGCNGDHVRQLKYNQNGILFDCSDFCKPEMTDTKTINGKICDDSSKNNPVTTSVATTDGQEISLSSLSFAQCIESSNGCNGAGNSNYIYVDGNYQQQNGHASTGCGFLGLVSGYKSLTLATGNYHIWTTSAKILSLDEVSGPSVFICGT